MPYYNAHNYVTTYLFDNVVLDLDSVLPVTCSDVVTLSARVSGDLTGHTFEWSQISGAPVTWLESVNQVNVMFQQPATRDDKIFRFTIDKGTAVAKYKDILVTAVPTDYLNSLIRQTPTVSTYGLSGLSAELTYLYIAPAIGEAGSVKVNDSNKSVIFTSPVQTYRQNNHDYFVNLLTKSGNDYNVISNSIISGISNGSSTYLNGPTVNVVYKLQASVNGFVQDTDTFSSVPQSQSLICDIGISDETIFSSSIYTSPTNSEVLESITRSLLTLEISEVEDQLSSQLFQTPASSEILEVMTRSLSTLDIDEIDNNVLLSISNAMALSEIVEVKSFQYSSLG